MPLEKKTVRFVDNFSTGIRGARCVESLLRKGYAVLHVRSTKSAFPFLTDLYHILRTSPEQILFSTPRVPFGTSDLLRNLVSVTFEDLFQYLFVLREACRIAGESKSECMIVLAAAVADFYVPRSEMAEDKIQSRSSANGLTLKLRNTPKMLGCIKEDWGARLATVISFKLETNENVLLAKSALALKRYKCIDAVCANCLDTRRDEIRIVVVSSSSRKDIDVKAVTGGKTGYDSIRGDENQPLLVRGVHERLVRRNKEAYIEPLLVDELCAIHSRRRRQIDRRQIRSGQKIYALRAVGAMCGLAAATIAVASRRGAS